jgi:hypothetical protein
MSGKGLRVFVRVAEVASGEGREKITQRRRVNRGFAEEERRRAQTEVRATKDHGAPYPVFL